LPPPTFVDNDTEGAKVKGAKSKRQQQQQQSSGAGALTIPLNTGDALRPGGKKPGTLNIPT
jgi:hypothetical protein